MNQPRTTGDIAPAAFDTLLQKLRQRAESAGVFASAVVKDGRLDCLADGSAETAWYRVRWDAGRVWVCLEMADRWQSESIETDLVHTGDKLDELLEEEMVELGYDGPRPTYEHFRSDDMLFTFRTPVDLDSLGLETEQAAERVALVLLGYEACFRQLGDMDADADGE
ncbi:MAG: hypothetical protein KIT54_02205 [Phycisphaeraceae bacterium]|nr:hypothetical protein [Phycisphaeraceae bacterium]